MLSNEIKLLIVSFSRNYDFQITIHNFANDSNKTLSDNKVYSMGSNRLIASLELSKQNILVDCPVKPGVVLSTFNFVHFIRVLREIKRIRPTHLYFYSSHLWNIMLIFLLRKKYTIIHAIHDIIPHENDKHEKSLFSYNRYITKHVNFIEIFNKTLLNELIHVYKVDSTKVITSSLYRPKGSQIKYKENNQILFFGRLNAYKGVDLLYEICKTCNNLNFMIVGNPDSNNPDVQKYTDLIKNLENCSVEYNYVDESKLNYYFNHSALVILPYRSASQSGVVLEAYRHSLPVVAFNVGALGEQIIDGKTGYLVEQNNLDAFRHAINSFISLSLEEKMLLSKNCLEFYNDTNADIKNNPIFNFLFKIHTT